MDPLVFISARALMDPLVFVIARGVKRDHFFYEMNKPASCYRAMVFSVSLSSVSSVKMMKYLDHTHQIGVLKSHLHVKAFHWSFECYYVNDFVWDTLT